MSKQKSADQRLIALESANQKLAAAQGELGKKQTRIAQLEADLAKLRSEAVAVEGEVASAKTEAATLAKLASQMVGVLSGCLQTIRETVTANPLFANIDRDAVVETLNRWRNPLSVPTERDSVRGFVNSAAFFFNWKSGEILEHCITGYAKDGFPGTGTPDLAAGGYMTYAKTDLRNCNVESRREQHERELATAPLATA